MVYGLFELGFFDLIWEVLVVVAVKMIEHYYSLLEAVEDLWVLREILLCLLVGNEFEINVDQDEQWPIALQHNFDNFLDIVLPHILLIRQQVKNPKAIEIDSESSLKQPFGLDSDQTEHAISQN